MGVPALFRWLSQKYPRIVQDVKEEFSTQVDGTIIPIDFSQANPIGEELDNLYLDMNGIIHPCTHPEDKPPPESEEEMMLEIFRYIDRIMTIVRPRKLLYMAIDGVAPRAKMNQQRSRRFRAAQEAQEKEEKEMAFRQEFPHLADSENAKMKFDSNCITPGTPFMASLTETLKYYIAYRLQFEAGWKNLKVILSDANVPGEGEHKIMDFIRKQRASSTHAFNTRHVIYGLDADLIMLALGTHEPHFRILREDVFSQTKSTACFVCGGQGHIAADCRGVPVQTQDKTTQPSIAQKPFIYLSVPVLREYLEFELKPDQNTEEKADPFNLEAAIDDWIFMCFFVGNDFLPHLPSLDIREGAIDRLINLYRAHRHQFNGNLTEHGLVKLSNVKLMLIELGHMESDIFQKRRQKEQHMKMKRDRQQQQRQSHSLNRTAAYQILHQDTSPKPINDFKSKSQSPLKWQENKTAANIMKEEMKMALSKKRSISEMKQEETGQEDNPFDSRDDKKAKVDLSNSPKDNDNNLPSSAITNILATLSDIPVKTELTCTVDEEEKKVPLNEKSEEEKSVFINDPQISIVQSESKEVLKTEEESKVDAPPSNNHDENNKLQINEEEDIESDDVRLWEEGYESRYYEQKFQADPSDKAFRGNVMLHYLRGLCWVMQYYFQGCQSWQWYYPFHYAPFARDIEYVKEDEMKEVNFELGRPFRPFEQLLAVFPAASNIHIPPAFRPLMENEKSEIIDFYPIDFKTDLNGKRHAWQGVVLLPFIDETRLLKAMEPLYEKVDTSDMTRNVVGNDILHIGEKHKLYKSLCDLYCNNKSKKPRMLDPNKSQKLNGLIELDPMACLPGSSFNSPLKDFGLKDIEDSTSVRAKDLHDVKYYEQTRGRSRPNQYGNYNAQHPNNAGYGQTFDGDSPGGRMIRNALGSSPHKRSYSGHNESPNNSGSSYDRQNYGEGSQNTNNYSSSGQYRSYSNSSYHSNTSPYRNAHPSHTQSSPYREDYQLNTSSTPVHSSYLTQNQNSFGHSYQNSANINQNLYYSNNYQANAPPVLATSAPPFMANQTQIPPGFQMSMPTFNNAQNNAAPSQNGAPPMSAYQMYNSWHSQ